MLKGFIIWIIHGISAFGTWTVLLVPRVIMKIPKQLLGLPRRIRRLRILIKIQRILIKILNLAATGFSLFLTLEPIMKKFQSNENK